MKTTLLISALAVSLNACAIDDDQTADVGEVEDVDGTIRRLSANALSPAELATATVGVSALTQTYADNMSQTKAGRAVMGYLVNCALPTGASITAQHSCNPLTRVCQSITYQGGIGLMTNWKTAVPTQAQQRLLSGCMFGRMNEFGYSLVVSLRGPGYAIDPGELDSHTFHEGAFFGNVFAGADHYWGSCDAEGPTHPYRQCAQDGHCSPVAWAGDCATACTSNGSGDYASCTGANGVTYSQPASVWLSSITQ